MGGGVYVILKRKVFTHFPLQHKIDEIFIKKSSFQWGVLLKNREWGAAHGAAGDRPKCYQSRQATPPFVINRSDWSAEINWITREGCSAEKKQQEGLVFRTVRSNDCAYFWVAFVGSCIEWLAKGGWQKLCEPSKTKHWRKGWRLDGGGRSRACGE